MTEESLLKLAKYNQSVRDTFEIVEDPMLKELPQYFIAYVMEDGETFDSHVIGFSDAKDVADVIAYFRQTGILRWKSFYHDPRLNKYEYVQPLGIYVLNTEAIYYKVEKREVVQTLEEQ